MKITIFGHGFVGGAITNNLIRNSEHEIVKIDPAHFDTKLEDHTDTDGIILCLPTPTTDGVCDDSIIISVLDDIEQAGLGDVPVLLKSTVTPNKMKLYPETVTYSPEFLRASTAYADFNEQKSMIFGGTRDGFKFWRTTFQYHPSIKQHYDRPTASMIKYMHNTWLAMKVAYFHEIFSTLGEDYDHESLVHALGGMENIGPSHMNAPNAVGELGFEGYCFPKDTQAFADFSGSEILKAAINTNNKLRKL
jgi:UDP-glucose 6-dehydrogenase